MFGDEEEEEFFFEFDIELKEEVDVVVFLGSDDESLFDDEIGMEVLVVLGY